MPPSPSPNFIRRRVLLVVLVVGIGAAVLCLGYVDVSLSTNASTITSLPEAVGRANPKALVNEVSSESQPSSTTAVAPKDGHSASENNSSYGGSMQELLQKQNPLLLNQVTSSPSPAFRLPHNLQSRLDPKNAQTIPQTVHPDLLTQSTLPVYNAKLSNRRHDDFSQSTTSEDTSQSNSTAQVLDRSVKEEEGSGQTATASEARPAPDSPEPATPSPPPPTSPLPPTPDEHLPSFVVVPFTSSESSRNGTQRLAYEELSLVKYQRMKYEDRCGEWRNSLSEYSKKFKDPEFVRSQGVIVMDWSVRGKFNGIGNEIQHYLELIVMGIATGRVAFTQTQLPGCEGTMLDEDSPKASASQLDKIRRHCHFDLGDFFQTTEGDSWKWDRATHRRVQKIMPDEKEVVVRWARSGMFWGSKKIAEPDSVLMKELMDYPEFRNHKLIRVVVEQEFGRWCHESKLPDGGSDFGMCQSYRWALGIEGHHPARVLGGGGSCFGFGVMQPKPFLKKRLLAPLTKIHEAKWTTVVGMHLRSGFSDVSSLPRPRSPPVPSQRPKPYRPEHMDAFYARHISRLKFQTPHCPEAPQALLLVNNRSRDGGLGDGGRRGEGDGSVAHAHPLFAYFACGMETAKKRDEVPLPKHSYDRLGSYDYEHD